MWASLRGQEISVCPVSVIIIIHEICFFIKGILEDGSLRPTARRKFMLSWMREDGNNFFIDKYGYFDNKVWKICHNIRSRIERSLNNRELDSEFY